MTSIDQELLSAYARSKDAEAFAALVERYQSLVYATSLRQLKNGTDAEDVTQEVFFSLATNAHKITADNLGGWLYRSALNASNSRLRSQQSRTRREQARAKPDRYDDTSIEWSQVEELLDVCLSELSPDARELIIQRYFVNRTQEDLAGSLGVDQATISRRLNKAVDQLRQGMAARGIKLTVAAVVAGLSDHASASEFPSGLSASLNKIGVAGVGEKSATILPLSISASLLWPMAGIMIAGLAISGALLVGALGGRDIRPTATVVSPAQLIPMGLVVEMTRLDYSKTLSSSGLAIDAQGQIAMYVDRPENMAGVYVVSNGNFQRIGQLPEHVRRALTLGQRSVVAIIYDQRVALVDNNRLRQLSETAAIDVSPSINARGWAAWVESEPVCRIRIADDQGVRTLHEADDRFALFEEVSINDDGDVAFRATTTDGTIGIFVSRQGDVSTIAEAGEKYKRIRPWFDFNNDGQVALVAQLADGTEVLCVGDDGGLEQVVRSGDYFATFLQVSLNDAGSVAFTARKAGDTSKLPPAGLYLWDGTRVVELLPSGQPIGNQSLDGVLLWRDSFNDAGQIAIVADFGPGQRSAILRLETDDL